MDNLIEIAFFIIAMLVAFIHWLIKESGVFKKKERQEERRQLVEQMEERHRRRTEQQQQAPARGTPASPAQQEADWRALREALGLPADAPHPGQSQHRHYEDSSDPECDDDVQEAAAARQEKAANSMLSDFEVETEGPAPKPAPPPFKVQEYTLTISQAEYEVLEKFRQGVAVEKLGLSSASETAAQRQADAAYDIPDGSKKQKKGRRRESGSAPSSGRTTISSSNVRQLLTSRDGIRQAILAREILGVPKAWQDDAVPTSRH